MAEKRIDELTAMGAALATEDLFAMVDDPSGTPLTRKATMTQLLTLIHANTSAGDVGAATSGHSHTAGEVGAASSGDLTAATTRISALEAPDVAVWTRSVQGSSADPGPDIEGDNAGKVLVYNADDGNIAIDFPEDELDEGEWIDVIVIGGGYVTFTGTNAGAGPMVLSGETRITTEQGGGRIRATGTATAHITAFAKGFPSKLTKTAAYTLTDADHEKRLLLDGTSAVVPVTVPQDLTSGFACHGRSIDTTNATTIISSGTMTLTLMPGGGSVSSGTNGATDAVIDVPVGATFAIDVESATRANVYVVAAP